jgi:hypothetical protein
MHFPLFIRSEFIIIDITLYKYIITGNTISITIAKISPGDEEKELVFLTFPNISKLINAGIITLI